MFKRLCIVLLFFLIAVNFAEAQRPFITTWNTENPGISADDQVFIRGTGTDYLIEWEEVGNPANNGSIIGNDATMITFPNPGIYQLRISGDFTRIWFEELLGQGCADDCSKLLSIDQWGDIEWESTEYAFWGCINLEYNASDVPDFSKVSSAEGMFGGCELFNGNLSEWDVSSITNMRRMFAGARIFNRPIGDWDVSNVTDMGGMFTATDSFNQYIGSWDVSNVNTMGGMFNQARAFNQPIGNWNVSNVSGFVNMFSGAISFNQPIGDWDVSSATTMSRMFDGARSFNQHIGEWDVSNVSSMIWMFHNARSFNQPIGDWDVSKVSTMVAMFQLALSFNQPLGDWDVSNVKTMNQLFNGATSFNQPIGNWNTSSVEEIYSMFQDATSFNQPIGNWNVSKVKNFHTIFDGAESFNQNLEDWDVSNATTFFGLFRGATSFNQPLNKWDVSNVEDMNQMLKDAVSFNQSLNNWDVSKVINSQEMFAGATSFNQQLDNWDVSIIRILEGMFAGASSFDQDLGNWVFHPDANLRLMLDNSGMSCRSYDQTLKGWNTNNDNTGLKIVGVQGLDYWLGEAARDSLINIKGWVFQGDRFRDCRYDEEFRPFITIWQTDLQGVSDDDQITIPGFGSDYLIEWEEIGNPDNQGTLTGSNQVTVTFPNSGIYRLSISGNFNRIRFNNGGDRLKLLSIEQWGDIEWSRMEEAFYGCSNMTYAATDAPDLSRVLSTASMFRSCTSFDGWINNWDVSTITEMSNMFQEAETFNQPLDLWDVSNVRQMDGMFSGAISFNQPLNDWDVSNVTRMSVMFSDAVTFNQPLDKWDVSAVTFMNGMFLRASSFDQNLGIWELHPSNRLAQMFNNSGMSCENYDLTLIGWADNPNTPDNRNLGAVGINYWQAAEARARLINEKGWNISGDAFADCDYQDCDLPPTNLRIQGQYPSCPGEEIRLRAAADGVEYIWFKNGALIAGQNEQTLIVTEAGNYSVIYTDDQNCESEESDALEISYLDATDPPILLNAGNAVLRSTRPNCRGFAFWEAEILTCGNLAEIEKRSLWRLDLFNTGQFDILSTQPRPDGSVRNNLRIEEELPLGIHRLVWEIRDEHGNLLIEEQLITLVDMNPPNPVCMHGISTNLSANTGTVTIPARVFDVGSWDDCTKKEDLIFTFSSNLTHTHHTWSCDDLDGEKEVTFTVEIWVTNQYGHQNRCFTYLKVQDNRDICPHSSSLLPLVQNNSLELKPTDITDFPEEEASESAAFLLHHNYPNPFTQTTTISFELPESGAVNLSIYNPYGGRFYHQSRHFDAGSNEWLIEGGELPHSGFYIYRLGFGGEVLPGRMLRLE